MRTEEIRKQIVKLMEKRDRASLDSKTQEQVKSIERECNNEIERLKAMLE